MKSSSSSREIEMQDGHDRESNFGMSLSTLDMTMSTKSPSRPRATTGFGINKQHLYGDEEEGRERITFTNNPSLARQDANAEDAEADKRASSDLRVVNFFNLVFFGSGTRMWIPIMWVVLHVANVSYLNILWSRRCHPDVPVSYCLSRPPYYTVLIYDIILVSVTASLPFGWWMVRSNFIENLIRDNCTTADAKHESRNMLWRITTGIMIGVGVVYTLFLTPAAKTYYPALMQAEAEVLSVNSIALPVIFEIVKLCIGFMFYCVTFYVASIWLWTCWVKVQVNKSLAESISLESISDSSFIDAFHDVYTSNSIISDQWKSNHIARVITCVPIAWVILSGGFVLIALSKMDIPYADTSNYLLYGCTTLCVGFTLYAMVWFTILGAGYVNDNGYNCCARAISALKYQDNDAMSAADNLTHRRYFEGHRMNALLRMDVMRNTSGFTFAGAVLSVQKAFAVGSVLVTIMNVK